MGAALLAVALAQWPALESADWVAHLRAQLTGVTSLTAEYTRTHRPTGRVFDNRLRLARRPNGGEWVGDLTARREGDPAVTRYTLWGGKVYEADESDRTVTEYAPADGDAFRMIADFYQPLLWLLTDAPNRPALAPLLVRREPTYLHHSLLAPTSRYTLALFAEPQDSPPVRATVVTVAADGYDIPRHLPRLIRVEESADAGHQIDVRVVRLDPPDGPTPLDISDPTKLPAGWRWQRAWLGLTAGELRAAAAAAERFTAEDRAQQKK